MEGFDDFSPRNSIEDGAWHASVVDDCEVKG